MTREFCDLCGNDVSKRIADVSVYRLSFIERDRDPSALWESGVTWEHVCRECTVALHTILQSFKAQKEEQ